jgi:DNA polymerase III alpha subunit
MIHLDEKESKIIEIINLLQTSIGKENVYLEIIAQDYTETADVEKINDIVFKIAHKENIKCVIGNNYFYPSYEDKEAREVALAIKD